MVGFNRSVVIFKADMTRFAGEVGGGNFGAVEIVFDVKREGESGGAGV